MSQPKVAICGVARTPIGKFMGALTSMSAVDLGILAVKKVEEGCEMHMGLTTLVGIVVNLPL